MRQWQVARIVQSAQVNVAESHESKLKPESNNELAVGP